jgi:phosphoribosylformylglycinamidine synthase PurS subunit
VVTPRLTASTRSPDEDASPQLPTAWAIAARREHSAAATSIRAVKARVLVRPKAGILDPQGAAVARALPALGFDGVTEVRVGRLIELEVTDAARLPEMCERLLANPLIEDYEVLLERDSG